jgi:copper chaperone
MATEILSYSVPGVTCEHCRTAITKEVGIVAGVESVDVDLVEKVVTVRGEGFEDAAVRAAVDEAGYDIDEIRAVAA